MTWRELIGRAMRAYSRPSPAMVRAAVVIVAAICIGLIAGDLSSWLGSDGIVPLIATLLSWVSIVGILLGLLWFAMAHLDHAGWVPAEDWKMHLALARDYLKGLVIRDRR
jgi:F0F1-type ATP synthase membrane subunit a